MDDGKMALWERVCKSNPKHLKEAREGTSANARVYTAIEPQSQVEAATREWGPYGSAWGLRDCQYALIPGADGGPLVQALDAVFYYPGGDFEISTDIIFNNKWGPVRDQRKKLRTAAQSKALSLLGFNADVFFGVFDGCQELGDEAKEWVEKEAALSRIQKARKPEKALEYARDVEGQAFREGWGDEFVAACRRRALERDLGKAKDMERVQDGAGCWRTFAEQYGWIGDLFDAYHENKKRLGGDPGQERGE